VTNTHSELKSSMYIIAKVTMHKDLQAIIGSKLKSISNMSHFVSNATIRGCLIHFFSEDVA
jgi:hypothetical protein